MVRNISAANVGLIGEKGLLNENGEEKKKIYFNLKGNS